MTETMGRDAVSVLSCDLDLGFLFVLVVVEFQEGLNPFPWIGYKFPLCFEFSLLLLRNCKMLLFANFLHLRISRLLTP
jgi:hypothetical protein